MRDNQGAELNADERLVERLRKDVGLMRYYAPRCPKGEEEMRQWMRQTADDIEAFLRALPQHGGGEERLPRLEIQRIASKVLQEHGLSVCHALNRDNEATGGNGFSGSNVAALMELFYDEVLASSPPAEPGAVRVPTQESLVAICALLCEPQKDAWDSGYNAGCRDYRDCINRLFSAALLTRPEGKP